MQLYTHRKGIDKGCLPARSSLAIYRSPELNPAIKESVGMLLTVFLSSLPSWRLARLCDRDRL
jgi:hypothetical protein